MKMILGLDKIAELVSNPEIRLVEGLSERELKNPEGTGLDLRVGKLSRFQKSQAFLSVDDRSTLDSSVDACIQNDGECVLTIASKEYVLLTTIEKINMPLDLVGIIRPRGTLFRSGLILMTGQINPGYNGEQTFGLFNASDYEFRLQLGARVAHVLFAKIDGASIAYRGQWNDGRISSPSLERQV
jgi:deoxycytidine triphosphate deaminase